MKPILLFLLAAASPLTAATRPNVLFIAIDDLKPLLGCYGDTAIKTPHIDRLAAQGTVFLNAHCQQAVCGPSRASLLTGLRPDTTQVWDLKTKIRKVTPDVVTLPQYFKSQGYESVGLGKIFDFRSVEGHVKDDPISWSRPYVVTEDNPDARMGFLDPEFLELVHEARKKQAGKGDGWSAVKKALGGLPAVEGNMDVPDEAYDDGMFSKKGVELIKELSGRDKPFFLAVGFKKPHLPFVAPKKYWDLYERGKMSLAEFQKMPAGAPDIHFQDSWELKNGSYKPYTKAPGLLPEAQQRELIHGYMACVSYIDAQVGKLLDALDQQGVAENTIVILWGDHGWHLGDHGMWCKHTNYEQATRSPLIIARRAKGGSATKSMSPVEFTDIYPTLCDLAGLPKPKVLEGLSLAPILDDPKARVRAAAMSQYPRGGGKSLVMGYAFRDERYRYIEWVPKGQPTAEPTAIELYDYKTDPHETENLANKSEHAEALKRMQGIARDFHQQSH